MDEHCHKGDQSLDKDIRLKAAIKRIMQCDLQKEDLMDPAIFAQADCVITACFLEFTSENLKEYNQNVKKMSNLLKPGGHLILIGILNATYMMVGEEKIHVLKHDESHARKALTEGGFTIDQCEIHNRKAESDLINYEKIIFITAHKIK
ncbi:nicotinamide N-methyltransferase-like isoform X2 [Hyla sarda]|uniref:nicotinamide N-methyltransferase-like isoform X2 n=1 Tax=Hyla sarda TaxID=327740 RepID=UPI0024C3F214|nr:nicotinamide N-methyltransferase-like isoform X2 [Hyla sarda]XP_056400414.1 nicotinamide N-methyltransferase-like isoform X2 [Hyla sarda]XP_056400415.1 nicotinamide N-methyltransferase-like isoform X2 [Hyla sarda]